MTAVYFCERNKFGYCRYNNTCRFRHIDEVCEKESCESEQCDKRHPKECIYFKTFNRCKFGDYCKYSHKIVDKTRDIFDLKEKFDNLTNMVECLRKEIQYIKEENIKLKKEIEMNSFHVSEDNDPQLDDHIGDIHNSFHEVKIVYVSESVEEAVSEITNYYIDKLPPINENTIEHVNDESGRVYTGPDHWYNKGKHKEYVFNLLIDKNYDRKHIEKQIFDDAVKEFSFLN